MPNCSSCGDEVTADQFVPAWGNCIPCVRRRQANALSDYVIASPKRWLRPRLAGRTLCARQFKCPVLPGTGEPGSVTWAAHRYRPTIY
jgi:hypothetical protein